MSVYTPARNHNSRDKRYRLDYEGLIESCGVFVYLFTLMLELKLELNMSVIG